MSTSPETTEINSVMPSDLVGLPADLNTTVADLFGLSVKGLEDIKQYISNKGACFLAESGDVEWQCMSVGTDKNLFYMRPMLSESYYDCYKDDKCVGAGMDSYQLGLIASAIGLREYGVNTKNEALINKALAIVEHVECTIENMMSNYVTENPNWIEDSHEEPEHITLASSFLYDFQAWIVVT